MWLVQPPNEDNGDSVAPDDDHPGLAGDFPPSPGHDSDSDSDEYIPNPRRNRHDGQFIEDMDVLDDVSPARRSDARTQVWPSTEHRNTEQSAPTDKEHPRSTCPKPSDPVVESRDKVTPLERPPKGDTKDVRTNGKRNPAADSTGVVLWPRKRTRPNNGGKPPPSDPALPRAVFPLAPPYACKDQLVSRLAVSVQLCGKVHKPAFLCHGHPQPVGPYSCKLGQS